MDYPVWPIFIVQAIALSLIFFPKHKRCLGMRFKTISIIILLLACAGIIISVLHDSTTPLNLHF